MAHGDIQAQKFIEQCILEFLQSGALSDQYHEPHHLKSLCHRCIRWKLIVVITGVREQTMLIRRHRFQEEQPQPQVQAEWMLVNGQLVCEWQPRVVEAETDHPLYLSNRHKAA